MSKFPNSKDRLLLQTECYIQQDLFEEPEEETRQPQPEKIDLKKIARLNEIRVNPKFKKQIEAHTSKDQGLSIDIKGIYQNEELQHLRDLIEAYGIKIKLAVFPKEMQSYNIELGKFVTPKDKHELESMFGITEQTHDILPNTTIKIFIEKLEKESKLVLLTDLKESEFRSIPLIKEELKKLEGHLSKRKIIFRFSEKVLSSMQSNQSLIKELLRPELTFETT